MENRLLPINALLGVLMPGDVTPAALADAGFQLAGLEVPAGGPGGSVTVDAVLFHPATSHLVAVEAKSGANVDERQARAYAQLRPADVVQSAYVTLPRRSPPTLEIVYLCLDHHVDRIRLGLNALGLPFPIIGVSDRRIRLVSVGVVGRQLRDAFVDECIVLQGQPARLMPFDQDSDVEVIKPRVLAALVSAMARSVRELTMTGLAEQATPHYPLFSRKAQTAIRKKVQQAARSIAEDDPRTFEVVPTTNAREGLIRIKRTPEDNDPRGRTQAYQAVGRSRTARRRRRRPEVVGQMDLLSMLDTGDNDSTGEAGSGQEGAR